MSTVTQIVKQTKQPRGGYINPRQFTIIQHEDDVELNYQENINPQNVGTVVDYLTRFLTGADIENAFQIPIWGAMNVKEFDHCMDLLEKVADLSDEAIIAACQLTGYDIAYRQGSVYYKSVSGIQPDIATIENIRTMVNRSLVFWNQYGPVVRQGFNFKGGYTKKITAGDGDFLTADTLWDFKVLSGEPKSTHTLQLIIYYVMGLHSDDPIFRKIKRLGIFNPRLNKVYLLDVDSIPTEVIQTVSSEIIGY